MDPKSLSEKRELCTNYNVFSIFELRSFSFSDTIRARRRDSQWNFSEFDFVISGWKEILRLRTKTPAYQQPVLKLP